MNKYKKLFSDMGLFTISNFGSKLLVFFLVPLYTNVLSTYEYGIIDLINSTINLLVPVLTLSIAEATLRFAFDKMNKEHIVLKNSLLVIVVSLIPLLFFKAIIVKWFSELEKYWIYFLIIYFFVAIDMCLSSYIRGIDKIKVYAIKGILYTAIFVSSNILFLVVLDCGLLGYLYATLLAEGITIFYMLVASKIRLNIFNFRLDTPLLKQMLRYSLPLIPSIIAWWVMQISDKYIIIYFLGLAASGIYGISYKIPTILSMVTSIFMQAWQISAIKSVEDQDNDKFVSKIYMYFTIFSVGACSVLILLAEMLGKILYAKEYAIAWRYVPILLMAYLFSGLSGVLASLFSAQKKTDILFHSTTIGAIVNIVLNFILIPKYGVMGAAYTTLLGFLVTWVIRRISISKFVNLETNESRNIVAFLLLIIQAICMAGNFKIRYLVSVIVILLCLVIYIKNLKELIKIIIKMIKKERK